MLFRYPFFFTFFYNTDYDMEFINHDVIEEFIKKYFAKRLGPFTDILSQTYQIEFKNPRKKRIKNFKL